VPDAAATRHAFARFLRSRRPGSSVPLQQLIRESGLAISTAAAYRVAVRMGLRGLRRSRTRYAAFWDTINWMLPDGNLAEIWGTSRGNLRSRRALIGAGLPRWRRGCDACSLAYRAALAQELQRAATFAGPRPR
jgi:hypothetical protein